MAKKKAQKNILHRPQLGDDVEILDAGVVVESPITQTLETNYMPYAMSVIVSRALPEIDGFKPAHRKLLYTMYEMNLLKGNRTKSANIVGSTMHLNPHGDQAIYDTMVRLARGNESLLVPYVSSKGNFGKAYSRDMACAASRYTEAKLEPICAELFADIDKETVDFVDNYDSTTTEPTLLPVSFPTILCNNTLGIAVGMASNICSFNLDELCETTIALLRDEKHEIISTLKAPDFVGGGYLLYDEAALRKIYDTGRGAVRMRAKYVYVKENNMIEISQIPPTTTVEAIMDKIAELVKSGRIREISDMRDETDLGGLKLTLDLKRGQDPEKLMTRLFKLTPLEDSFNCNFNILVGGQPRVMGVREILTEWSAFRTECVRRRTYYDLTGKEKRLHLLRGLKAILLDIDKAVRIVRETEEESEVVPNLMIGFGIDKVQGEYVAEIKLRHLNREYILRRTEEISSLEDDIADLREILEKPARIKKIIIAELQEVRKKYGQPRRTEILYEIPGGADDEDGAEEMPDYPVTVFYTEEGYFKKITPQSLRMSNEQKLKEGDALRCQIETKNNVNLLFFTNKAQVYKCRAGEFDDTKASVLGEYIPARMGMEDGELPLYMALTEDFKGYMVFFFENGKAAKIPMESYQTKQNRRKLLAAFNDKSPVVHMEYLPEEAELAVTTSAGRMLLVHSTQIPEKATRTTVGVAVVTLKKNVRIESVRRADMLELSDPHRYRVRTLPATGALVKADDIAEQISF
ncbi:DNA topoisomerase (ATP-hydrolyzing) subunit A [Pygmaiobacter massiliensis]|uniref:DNA topoisomerase (ATP-hydrolyzing) subunit A n=1 Tax=Pygmaiobacter massiliensis TaxID=1917873 RepID=UPI002A80CA55|nr:DNA topoisomerase (ATP-hydrolyzing) subunit A [Pygmaiobacter massiliensis]MDY4783511.1 DNA topoisomerase (ATP-hydrolyzing) subunit A [Pygmaiobacter massiliensis]